MYSFAEWESVLWLAGIPLLEYIRSAFNKLSSQSPTKSNRRERRIKFTTKHSHNQIVGLPNLGNTCYMNSAINVLIRLPLNHYDELLYYWSIPSNSLTYSYTCLIRKVNSLDECNIHGTIAYIKQVMGNYHHCYRYSTQEDSMEFYTNFINLITKEYNHINNNNETKIEHNIHRDINEQIKFYQENFYQNNFFKQLFYITSLEEYLCFKCNRKNYNIESGLKITLKTQRSNSDKVIDIFDLLLDYFSSKRIHEGELMCDYCREAYIIGMKTYLVYLPKILCIHIDKICDGVDKDSRRINPLYNLDMSYFTSMAFSSQGCHYSLFATINHVGSKEFGHYTANVFIDNQFYHFDDQRVKLIEPDCIFKNAVSLFYIKSYKNN